jgi:hypothetical protein
MAMSWFGVPYRSRCNDDVLRAGYDPPRGGLSRARTTLLVTHAELAVLERYRIARV